MPTFIVTVERPVLTEEERNRRMEAIKRGTVEFLLAVEKGRNERNGKGKENS